MYVPFVGEKFKNLNLLFGVGVCCCLAHTARPVYGRWLNTVLYVAVRYKKQSEAEDRKQTEQYQAIMQFIFLITQPHLIIFQQSFVVGLEKVEWNE